MTKEITKAFILQQMQDKLKFREWEAAPFLFDETVRPVYNIENHLKTWETRSTLLSVTGTGGLNILSVTQTERITVSGYTVVFYGAGAYTVAGVYLTRKNSSTLFVYLDLTAGQSVAYTVNLPKPVILDSKDKLYVNIDGYTSTQNIEIIMDVSVEELR